MKKQSRLKIGCDPEFMPIMPVKMPDAYEIAREGGPENFDFDRESFGRSYQYNKHITQGHIGSDGANSGYYIGELRPKPGTPHQVVNNLRTMIRHLQNKHVIMDLIAGGGIEYNESLGGHIHFGVKLPDIDGFYDDPHDVPDAEHELFRALDHFIGIPLQKKKGGDRDGGGYGNDSDVREQPHGFEYRTPPSWLTSPELAEGVLWMGYAIVKYYQEDRSFWAKTMRHLKGKTFKPQSLSILKLMCPARGKKMIDVYARIIRDKKFNLAQKGAITNWTGKKVVP